jgi:hypothetical protein
MNGFDMAAAGGAVGCRGDRENLAERARLCGSQCFQILSSEPYRKGTDKMINRDKLSISLINRG